MSQNENYMGPEGGDRQNVPPGGQAGYYYQSPPPPPQGWFFQNGQWYNQPYAPDGTCLVAEDRNMAMLAYLLLLLTGFIGPLILYFAKRDESRFVAFHALQAVYFRLVCTVLALVTCGISMLVLLIFAIITAAKASEGKWEKYWLAGDWAMKSVMRQPTQR